VPDLRDLNADLHCHSDVSDGTLSPAALAARARGQGVELWSLTASSRSTDWSEHTP